MWICSLLGVKSVAIYGRLRWFGHLEHDKWFKHSERTRVDDWV